ncbi:MAG: biotin/lipoyl-binding protein [Oscillatoriales cyanobacterium SM2_1_8]|nr:biotin/lipoyl-binding protein [Oscillatoriales cyanobacterium SM2_1_8]
MSQTPHTASPSPETNGALAKVAVTPPTVAAGQTGIEMLPDAVDQPVIYERTIFWSRLFVWLIVGITTGSVAWAYFSKIDESVPAIGRLETKEAVREIQTPTAGVILELKVKDGDKVAAGDLLLTLDPTGPKADRATLLQSKAALETENQFYQSYLEDFQVPLIDGENVTDEFVQNLQRSLDTSANDFRSRVAAADLEVTQLESQAERVRQQIEGNRRLILANVNILGRTQAILETNRKILEDMRPVSESGALSLLQFRQQEQRVQSAEADKLSREGELVRLESEINQLQEEAQRLTSAISQGKERRDNVVSQFRREFYSGLQKTRNA